MNKDRLTYLIRQYQIQQETDLEAEELVAAWLEPNFQEMLHHALDDCYAMMRPEEYRYLKPKRSEEIINHILASHPRTSLRAGVDGNTDSQSINIGRFRKMNSSRIISIAAVIAIALFGIWFFVYPVFKGRDSVEQQIVLNDADINPGHSGASLVLANGNVIKLDSAKSGVILGKTFTYNDNTAVEYAQGLPQAPQKLTARTQKGQSYLFTLPDGSRVWLNADSKLEFSSDIASAQTRVVQLVGEGYFQVAKNKAHPFIVKTQVEPNLPLQQTEVLGTEFNVTAYPEEINRTTLVEGSVQVTYGDQQRVIQPRQQAYSEHRNLSIANVDTDIYTAWKDNKFVFEDMDLRSIMRTVARWYDVELDFHPDLTKQKFWLHAPRYSKISVLLKDLESTGKVQFQIEGKKIYVK